MIKAKAQYVGGHPAAVSGSKRCIITVDEQAVRCSEPRFKIPLVAIQSAEPIDPPNTPRDFRFSPLAGLFGGVKENSGPASPNGVLTKGLRELHIIFRDEHGDDHTVRLGKIYVEGRTWREGRADLRENDAGGIERFAREILAARYRTKSPDVAGSGESHERQ